MGQEKEAAGDVFLSLVIPVFNEEESLPHLWDQIDSALATVEWAWEAIFVDDGSTDTSFAVLGKLAKQHPQVCALRFRRNYRKAAALAAGFKQARGQVIVTMDADLQDDPREIPRLLDELNRDCDLVSGWKAKRRDPLSKTLPSRLFNWITSLVSGFACAISTAASRRIGARWPKMCCLISTENCIGFCPPLPIGWAIASARFRCSTIPAASAIPNSEPSGC